MSAGLLLAVRGNTNTLIPMFAIGVFIVYARTGRLGGALAGREHLWKPAPCSTAWEHSVTAAATIVFLLGCSRGGVAAGIAVPAFILLFHRIHSYYHGLHAELGLGTIPAAPEGKRTRAIVPLWTSHGSPGRS